MKTVVLTDQARVRVCLRFPTFLLLKSAAYAVHRVKVDSKLIDWANLNFGRWPPFLRSWSCIGSGYASSLFFLLGLPPSFLASGGFAAQRSRARALPLPNLKKKRDRSQSISHLWIFMSRLWRRSMNLNNAIYFIQDLENTRKKRIEFLIHKS